MIKEIPGFPWCDIPKSKFNDIGLSLGEIDLTQARRINLKDWSKVIPYLDSLGPLKFTPCEVMGLYLSNNAVGFSIGGVFPRGENLCGEVGMVYIRTTVRNFGLGSILLNLATLRILQQNPKILVYHIGDESGVIERIASNLGFINVGYSNESPHPEWELKISSPQHKEALSQQTAGRINRRLELLEPDLPHLHDMATY